MIKDAIIMSFLNTCIDIFFKNITVSGYENVPQQGPVIFVCAPHANQFLDPIIVLRGIRRKTGFLAAAVSLRKAIIGDIGRAMGSIPVERPQDVKFAGHGKLSIQDNLVIGNDSCTFKAQLTEGASVCINGLNLVIASVESDNKATLKKSCAQIIPEGEYKIIPKLDQEEVFATVANKLIAGEAIGIFPEGGSHDRTDLLPLKAGVTIMALTALEMTKGELPLKIVPCGLNYFHGHRFRSEAYLDIGEAITVPQPIYQKYISGKDGKREACNELLNIIKDAIKLVTTQAPNYEALRIFWTLRQIYTPIHTKLSTVEKVKITRRFARVTEALEGKDEIIALKKDTKDYIDRLHELGIDDHQVAKANFGCCTVFSLLFFRIPFLVIIFLLTLPGVILSYPIIYITTHVAMKKAKEAKAGSSVKVAGRDVIATWLLLTSIPVIPIMLLLYYIIFIVCVCVLQVNVGPLNPLYLSLIFVFLLPTYMWLTVKLGDVLAYYWSSVPGLRVQLLHRSDARLLKDMRLKLQESLLLCFDKYGKEFASTDLVSPAMSPLPKKVSISRDKDNLIVEEETDEEGEVDFVRKESDGSVVYNPLNPVYSSLKEKP